MTLSAFLPLVGVDTSVVLDRVQRAAAAAHLDAVNYEIAEAKKGTSGESGPLAVVWVSIDAHGRALDLAGVIESSFRAALAQVWPGYEDSGVDVLLKFVA